MKQQATNRAARHIKQTGVQEQITEALNKLRRYDFLPTNPFKELVSYFRLQEQLHWMRKLQAERWISAEDSEISDDRIRHRVQKIQALIGLPAVETLRGDDCKLEVVEIPDVLQHQVNSKHLPTKDDVFEMAVCICLSGLPVEDSLNFFVRRILAEAFAVDSNQASSVIGLRIGGKSQLELKMFNATELRTQRGLISTSVKAAVIEKRSVVLEFLMTIDEPVHTVASRWLGPSASEVMTDIRLLRVIRSYEFASVDGTDVATARAYCFFPCPLQSLVSRVFLEESEHHLYNAVLFAHTKAIGASKKDVDVMEGLLIELLQALRQRIDDSLAKHEIVSLAEAALFAEIAARMGDDASIEDFDSLELLCSQPHAMEEFYSMQQGMPGIVKGLRQFVANLATACSVLTAAEQTGFDSRTTTQSPKLISFGTLILEALKVVRTSVLDLVCGAVSSDFASLDVHAHQLLQELQTLAGTLQNAMPVREGMILPAYALQSITATVRRAKALLDKIQKMLHGVEFSLGLDVLQYFWEQRSETDNFIPPKPRSYLLFKWKHKKKKKMHKNLNQGLHSKPSVLLIHGLLSEVCGDVAEVRAEALQLNQQLSDEGIVPTAYLKGLQEPERQLVFSDVAAGQMMNWTHLLTQSWHHHQLLIAMVALPRNSIHLYGGISSHFNQTEELERRDLPDIVAREGSFLRYMSERLVQHALSQAVRECLLCPSSIPVYFTLTATLAHFATQADLWVQDDDLVLQNISRLSAPMPQEGNSDVFGVRVQAASNDVGLPLERFVLTSAGAYATEELLAGCDVCEIFRWFWALPPLLAARPREQAGMKVAMAVGFAAATALQFGHWTSPVERASHATGDSLSDLSLFWGKKANSELPIERYCCNRFRSSIPLAGHPNTIAFNVASSVNSDGEWEYDLSTRQVSSTGPLRYPGLLQLMAPVNFQYSMADMAFKVPTLFANIVNDCVRCLHSQHCFIRGINFPDGTSAFRQYVDAHDSNDLTQLLSRFLEVSISFVALVPLRCGLPDISAILQSIEQVNQTTSRGVAAGADEYDVARDDSHRTSQESHVRQLLREALDSPTDRVYVRCDICFGAVTVGPARSMRPLSVTAKQSKAVPPSVSLLDQFRYATVFGSEQAARRVFRGLDQLGDKEQRQARLVHELKMKAKSLLDQNQIVEAAQMLWPACKLQHSDLLSTITRVMESECARLSHVLAAIETALDILRVCTKENSAMSLDDTALMRMLSICICFETRICVTSPQVVQLRGCVALALSLLNTLEQAFEVPQLALAALPLRNGHMQGAFKGGVDETTLLNLQKLHDIETTFDQSRGKLHMKFKDSRNVHLLISILEELRLQLEQLVACLSVSLNKVCGSAMQQYILG